MIHRIILFCGLLVFALVTPAAHAQTSSSPAGRRKQAVATKLSGGTINVDGRLDEEIWLQAARVADFVQKEPTEGAAPTDGMEVRFVYDDTALYVGARMEARNARGIQAPLGRRDDSAQAEYVIVSFDTFLDRQTAVGFGVTAAGVRLDRYHSSDEETSYDAGFDPVWEARTSQDADGWSAELWIPFSQLRFNPQVEQLWGLNIVRSRPTLDEEDYWVLIPRTERFWSSRFGELRGISGVRPTRRIELLPYVAGAATHNADRDRRNPFDDGRNLESRVGADLKMGMGPNLTLEATVNPDFGQVEADPAEVNLTAFETRFPEKRPFFLEGLQLFTPSHPNFYYSRRIGTRPIGSAAGLFVDYPSSTTILTAAKLTGRLPSGTSIGLLSAITDDETAQVSNPDSPLVSRVGVVPRAYFGIARVRQELGRTGSTAGLFFNTVHRDIADGDPLADLYSRNALAVGGDSLLRFKGGEYQLLMSGGASFVAGTASAMERFQRSSSHYAQRPDKDYALIDPTRTSLTGFSIQTRFERVSGRHWLWSVANKIDSPFFETNDIANLNGADGIQPSASITWRETRPGPVLRAYSFGLNQMGEWNFSGNLQTAQIRPSANFTWRNYWTTSVQFTKFPEAVNAFLTRGGPLMQVPAAWSLTASVGNRSNSQTRWTGSVNIGGDDDGGSTRRANGSLAFRPGPQWQFSAAPFYDRVTSTQQYVTTVAGGGRLETFNNRYVFAFIDRSTASTEFRLGYTLRPDMNLDVYMEPFAASGRYYDVGELLAPGSADRVTYGAAGGTSLVTLPDGTRTATADGRSFALRARDFNTLSFRSNIVLRWEWRPGSTLYLVWQQDRSGTEVVGSRVNVGDMFRSLTAPGSNYFVVKTSFWLSVK